MMKKSLFIGFLLLVLLSCNKQKKIEVKAGMVLVEGGRGMPSFWMDQFPVTVVQFERFVNATHYVTEAEKFGDAGYFDFKTGTWLLKTGANWRFPLGKDAPAALAAHPVTQVSWHDAQAYCSWAGKRLPTSQEFVFVEKNGVPDYEKIYTWGDTFIENGSYKANFWQGVFPVHNTIADGFLTTSPVGFFGLNILGFGDIGGNVWQWCSDDHPEKVNEKIQRGGSFLCDPNICHGFKVGGVSSSSPETSLLHVGFRCVKDAK